MAMMAAEVLGVPIEHVRPIVGDTASIGFSHLTGGSRVTFATGMAVTQAAERVVDQLKQRAAADLGDPGRGGRVERRQGLSGRAQRRRVRAAVAGADRAQGRRVPAGRSARRFRSTPRAPGPAFGCHICDVEVDRETGHVKILRYTAVQDVGKAIHPCYVEGQIQGGAAQGIGWALNEEYIYDKRRQDGERRASWTTACPSPPTCR